MEIPTIYLPPVLELKLDLTESQFWQLCRDNNDLRFEKTANGELIIMSPTGGNTSNNNAGITAQLWLWNERSKKGKVFDSNGCFQLPNGAKRAPDSSWIKMERWNSLTPEDQDSFPPICPDFVVELMSPSDSLLKTREKMQEYIENGAELGWLINRKQRQVEIYRQGQEVEILENPQTISGENILPEFVLDLATI